MYVCMYNMIHTFYPTHAVVSSTENDINIKRMEKKLDGNYTRMLRAILYKSWRQQPTK